MISEKIQEILIQTQNVIQHTKFNIKCILQCYGNNMSITNSSKLKIPAYYDNTYHIIPN
jgi:hypothetical protein